MIFFPFVYRISKKTIPTPQVPAFYIIDPLTELRQMGKSCRFGEDLRTRVERYSA